MNYIGNILTQEPFIPPHGEVLYNVVSKKEDLLPGIPTLVIGWDNTKENFPEASIIEWVVNENIYWTYGKYEKRERFEENLRKFSNVVLKKLFEKIKYSFFDVLTDDNTRFLTFLKSLSEVTPDKTIYTSKDMLYVYYSGHNYVFGISLRDCDYLDTTYKKQIFSAIHNSDSIYFLNKKDAVHQTDLRDVKYMVKNNEYILPYLFSRDASKTAVF